MIHFFTFAYDSQRSVDNSGTPLGRNGLHGDEVAQVRISAKFAPTVPEPDPRVWPAPVMDRVYRRADRLDDALRMRRFRNLPRLHE
jgi:hypothetical protein